MNKISCFLPYAGKEQVEKTVNSLQATGLIEEIRLITTDATLESPPDCDILFVDMPYSTPGLPPGAPPSYAAGRARSFPDNVRNRQGPAPSDR